MKVPQRMLTFVVVLMATMMALNEFPELLTLTDNVSNDYVSVRIQSEISHHYVAKDFGNQPTAVPVIFNPPVQMRVAAASNFLLSPEAKAPGSLLLLLVTQRT